MDTTIYLCEDSLEGIFTGVYDAWASRKGHSHIRLQLLGETALKLFCVYTSVQPDAAKTEKVKSAIQTKISQDAWQMVYRAAMSPDPAKADAIYRFLVGGFYYGPQVTHMLAEPAVQKIFALDRQVGNETHYYREFLRFDVMENDILLAKIRPKSNVLSMVAPHFADRISGENFLILDVGRNLAAIHPANRLWYMASFTEEQLKRLLSGEQDIYRELWKTFHHAVAIEQRRSPKLQRSLMPLRYREFMPENETERS